MNCQQIDRYIFDFCEQNLSPELEIQIQEHIEQCPICRNKIELTRLENEVLSESINSPVLDDNFTSDVLNLIKSDSTMVLPQKRQYVSEQAKSLRKFKIPQAFSVPAMVAIIVICALLIPGLNDIHSNIKLADGTKNVEKSNLDTKSDSGILVDSESSTRKLKKDLELGAGNSYQQQQSSIAAENRENNSRADEQISSISQAAEDGEQTPLNEKSIKNFETDEAVESISENNPICVYPINLPADYQLLQIISSTDDELTYIFLDTTSKEELVINISPLRTEPFNIAAAEKIREEDAPIGNSIDDSDVYGGNSGLAATPLPGADSGSIDKPTPVLFSTEVDSGIEKEAAAPGTSANNSINWDINLGKQYYKISLKANLSPEKLAQIAQTIEFKEDNNNE